MIAIKHLGYEISKNLKLIFRNWTSLALIIIAPLLLILLVGYSFSGEQLHDIRLGIVGNIDLQDLEENISSFAELERYNDIDTCIVDMALARTHLCLQITGSFQVQGDEIPTGEVAFYYDNTRKRVSLLLLTQIKDYFGLTSERISLISTQAIINNIQDLVIFLNARVDDIDNIEQQARAIRIDLEQRREQLIEVRDDFTPKYLLVKSIQNQINTASSVVQTEILLTTLQALKNTSSLIPSLIINFTNFTIPTNNLDQELDNVINQTNATINRINLIESSLDEVVSELDAINTLLNDEINRTESYIKLINQSLLQIESLSKEARSKLEDLEKIDPSLASKIVKPITQSFIALKQDLRDVQVAFPVLLSTVIIFISILFANILSLLEIHNKAYTRNILAPVNDLLFIVGMGITNFFIISFQIIVLLIVAQTQFGINVLAHLSVIPVLLTLTLIFICIGMTLAYLSKNMQTSILLSTFTALGFFLLSDTLNALEAMPKLAAQVAVFNPLVITNSILRKIFFFDISLSQMPVQLGILLFYLVLAIGILVVVAKRKNKERI